MVLTFTIAYAQEPPPQDEPYEVIVYGELLVEQAKQKVIERLSDLGYDAVVIDRGDHVVYRHQAPWHGEVVLYDDGWMQVKRQPLHVMGPQMPWAKENTPLAWAGCVIYPWLCLKSSGATFSQRKWRGLEARTVDEIAPDVRIYGDRVADLATSRKVDALPDKLMRLWTEGIPIQSAPEQTTLATTMLATAAARREALYTFWASRTETAWGEQVREAIESFCRGVVQTSDEPFTADEIARYAMMNPERPFLQAREAP